MPRRCTICHHAEREAVDSAILTGESLRDIARRFAGVSKDAVARHKADHLAASMVAAAGAAEVARADTLLDKIRALESEARRIGQRAHAAGDLKTALAAIRELTRIAELQAKLIGELSDAPTVNVTLATDWIAIRSNLLLALAPFPDARLAVVSALGTEASDA